MGFFKRKNKKFEYKPRYYKGDGNPYEIKHKLDQFRSTTGKNKSLKGKIVKAIDEFNKKETSIEYGDEVYELADDSKGTSNKIILYIIILLVLAFLFIIDFDLSIFYNQ